MDRSGKEERFVEMIKLRESIDEHAYYDYLEDHSVYNVLCMIKNGEELFKPLINPSMYQQALNEFTKFGKLDRFPVKYVYQWFGIIMKNTAIIRAITSIAGHDYVYPTEEIIDACFSDREEFEEYKKTISNKGTFSPDFGWTENEEGNNEEIDDNDAICQYLEDNDYYGKMVLPDGSSAWSDYGLSPLEEIIMEYNENMEPEKVLVLINRALDVTHQRGDLCSAFIEGGSKTLSQISNSGYVNENKQYTYMKKNVIRLNESQLRQIVKESVKKVLEEMDYPDDANFEEDNINWMDVDDKSEYDNDEEWHWSYGIEFWVNGKKIEDNERFDNEEDVQDYADSKLEELKNKGIDVDNPDVFNGEITVYYTDDSGMERNDADAIYVHANNELGIPGFWCD